MHRYMKTATTILILTLLLSCNQIDKPKEPIAIFKKPVIVQPQAKGSIKYFEADFVDDFFPPFACKHQFTDTLFIPDKRFRDTTFRKDFISRNYDTLMTDGFELIPDYATDVYRNEYQSENSNYYYPVYLINQTPTVKAFIGKDNYVFGLQEALDTNGMWRPIEGRGFDFCGMGFWGLKVRPQEFITVLFPKYAGEYKTKMRVRIKNGDNIYVSKPYEGTINENQLNLKKGDYLYRELRQNEPSTIIDLFYGAVPLGIQDE